MEYSLEQGVGRGQPRVYNIWRIGLADDDTKIENPMNWKGLNLLGFALMEVRDELM